MNCKYLFSTFVSHSMATHLVFEYYSGKYLFHPHCLLFQPNWANNSFKIFRNHFCNTCSSYNLKYKWSWHIWKILFSKDCLPTVFFVTPRVPSPSQRQNFLLLFFQQCARLTSNPYVGSCYKFCGYQKWTLVPVHFIECVSTVSYTTLFSLSIIWLPSIHPSVFSYHTSSSI